MICKTPHELELAEMKTGERKFITPEIAVHKVMGGWIYAISDYRLSPTPKEPFRYEWVTVTSTFVPEPQ